ncbi:MAG: pseudouridine synthase [bacterium]
MRLQKFIANQGICSRRQAEELIKAGKIKVNNQIAELGDKINPDDDCVEVGGKLIRIKNQKVYIILNKPIGYITSTTNKQGKSVIDLISVDDKKKYGRLFPVGRLDKDSQGLVLLTNDGELTNLLTHPRYEHIKKYQVVLKNRLEPKDIEILQTGMNVKGEKFRGIEVKTIKKIGKKFLATIILKEGKNRQIRRMFGNLGYIILDLRRIGLGKLKLKNLPLGKYNFLEKQDII